MTLSERLVSSVNSSRRNGRKRSRKKVIDEGDGKIFSQVFLYKCGRCSSFLRAYNRSNESRSTCCCALDRKIFPILSLSRSCNHHLGFSVGPTISFIFSILGLYLVFPWLLRSRIDIYLKLYYLCSIISMKIATKTNVSMYCETHTLKGMRLNSVDLLFSLISKFMFRVICASYNHFCKIKIQINK